MLLLGGSNETYNNQKGSFQELDHVSMLAPHSKYSTRPGSVDDFPRLIRDAYRTSYFGRPGASFLDLPADFLRGPGPVGEDLKEVHPLPESPKPAGDDNQIAKAAAVLRNARAPLVVIGKGAAYARAENEVRELINATGVPFLPSPMGKGVVPDSHPSNVSSARSAAMKGTDVVLMLGARLNWIMSFGEHPKWNPEARIIQVDISAEEIGKNAGTAELGITGDIKIVVPQLLRHLNGWRWNVAGSAFSKQLRAAKDKNEATATALAQKSVVPLSYERAFEIIKRTLHSLSPAEEGGICYVSEGSNTMDISRSIFPLEHPRLKLDAGSYGTMGIGMGYAIAAHEAYNGPKAKASSGPTKRKKIVCLEGDSGFGFSGMEVETMARHKMDILIFIINNGGIYSGDSNSEAEWKERQQRTATGELGSDSLRGSTLGWEVKYEKLAEAVGGKGYFVRTSDELAKAAKEGFQADVPVIVNVIIESIWKGPIVSAAKLIGLNVH